MRFITHISALLLAALTATTTFAQDGLADHKLALQISDNNPQKNEYCFERGGQCGTLL